MLARFPWLSLGIMALATELLNGPIMTTTSGSAMKASAFLAPCAGSWAEPPGGTSSRNNIWSCVGLPSMVTPPALLAWSMASWTPLRVGMPSLASAPETGRSTAILTTPLDPPLVLPPVAVVAVAAPVLPPPVVAGVLVAAVSPPQAVNNMLALTLNESSSMLIRDFFIEALLHGIVLRIRIKRSRG